MSNAEQTTTQSIINYTLPDAIDNLVRPYCWNNLEPSMAEKLIIRLRKNYKYGKDWKTWKRLEGLARSHKGGV